MTPRFVIRGKAVGNRCYVFDTETDSIIALGLSFTEAMEMVQIKNSYAKGNSDDKMVANSNRMD